MFFVAVVVASGLAGCAGGTHHVPAPQELTTGPVLQWTELEVGLATVLFVETTSDGRVVAAGGLSDGAFAARVSDNGTEWAALPLPDGIVPLHVDAAGDRWVLIGERPDDDTSRQRDAADVFGRVFISADHGATWTEAMLAAPQDESLPQYVARSSRIVEALTSGDQAVVAVLTFTSFDVEALLSDQGRVPADMYVAYWQLDDDSLTFFSRDLKPDANADDEIETTLSYEELSLSHEQVAALENAESDARIRLFAGDGTTLAHMAVFGSSDAVGRWTDSGFVVLTDDWSHVAPQPRAPEGPDWEGVMLVVTLEDLGKLTSPDGREWRSEPFVEYSEGTNREASAIDAAGVVWSSWRKGSEQGRVRITRESADQPPVETAEFERLSTIEPLEVGPAGLAAVATLVMPDGWSYARSGRAAKDGYELRYDEPSGGVTLWDVSLDKAVYVFESRLFDGPGTPVGTHQRGEGMSYRLAFDNPDSTDELVAFDAFDLQPVFGTCWWTSGRPGVFVQRQRVQSGWHAGVFPGFWPWVGWSANGVDWGWQALPEAFDTCDAGADLSLAVGTDYVVALLQPSTPRRLTDADDGDDSGAIPPTAPRLFVAQVP